LITKIDKILDLIQELPEIDPTDSNHFVWLTLLEGAQRNLCALQTILVKRQDESDSSKIS